MALSLRARLTAWYTVLLVLTVAAFSAAVLWVHWRLLLERFDESLVSISATANNIVAEELSELNDLGLAAGQLRQIVHPPDYVVQVLDESASPIHKTAPPAPLPSDIRAPGFRGGIRTVTDADGRGWRVNVTSGSGEGRRYLVAVGAPLDEVLGEWRTLLKACLVGIPIVFLFAVGGGWWLGRHGLRPLTAMSAEAQAITAKTLDSRLTVPPVGEELERLAVSFNRVLDRLGSALSTQRRFMADASHELRTPVSIIRTAADVTLSKRARDESEYREALAAVSQQSSRLTRLVDDMLVLARADGGGYPIVLAELDLTELVAGCVREFGGRAEDRDIRITTSLEPVWINGDEALLRRMFGNLLNNALTYTPRGGSVDVSLARSQEGVELRITDTGPGIPPEDRERVFERFVRLDPARGAGGAGLGLAIARWVAEAHGGGVRIASSGSTGTTFVATLPAEDFAQGNDPRSPAVRRNPSNRAPHYNGDRREPTPM
jgi:two-component system, OmpR family, sensor kinase